MSDTQKPAYTRTNVQEFVDLLGADTNISRHAYALFQSAGEISYDEVATYRAEAYATSIELENAKKHLELAENALHRNAGQSITAVKDLKESIAALTAENDFLKDKVCQLGGIIEGFTPTPKVTYTFATQGVPGPGTWTVKPLKPEEPQPGDGYRWVEVHEVLEEGDEIQGNDGRWRPTYSVGRTVQEVQEEVADNRTYRRKIEPAIDPGKGYRLLEVGERIYQGDECYQVGQVLPQLQWKETQFVGATVGENDRVDGTYRRRLKPVVDPTSGYREVADNEVIQFGDEFAAGPGRWEKSSIHGLFTVGELRPRDYAGLCDGSLITYRRKIEPAAETPNNPFASYVAPKKEQKYRELGPQEAIQRGDEYQYYAPTIHEKRSDDWHPVIHGFGLKPYQWHGSVLFRRPITEKDAE
jgi:hypothetical protein